MRPIFRKLTRRPEVLAALSSRNYRLFWFGMVIAVTGFHMLIVGQVWLVDDLTKPNSAPYLGLLGLMTAAPAIALTLVGGVVADKMDPLRLLIGLESAIAALMLTLAALTFTGVVRVEHILLIAFCRGTIGAFDQPARQALFAPLIDRRYMTSAVALNSVIWQGTRIIGPAVAGLLMMQVGAMTGDPRLGAAAAFAFGSLGSVTSVLFLTRIRVPPVARAQGGSVARDLVAGVRFIWSHSIFASLIGMTFFNSFFGMSFITLMPIFVRSMLGTDQVQAGLGFLFTSQGIGGFLGTITAGTLGGFRRRGWLIILGAVLFGSFLVLFSQSSWYPASIALIFLAGFSTSLYMVVAQSTLHMLVPDEIRGRVMGVWGMTHTSVMPLGGLQMGMVANFTSAPIAVALGGFAVVAFAVFTGLRNAQVRRLGTEASPVLRSAGSG